MINLFSHYRRTFSILFIVVFSSQLLIPTMVFALTGGPSQPEVQSFQPAGTSDMVDIFSGDFSYNIPLFELPGPNGGYPFNLSYQSGVSMDQEASWVGLGWTLQPGAITRQMRGLPDEFKGDLIKTKMSIDPSVTVGLGAGATVEVFGGDASLGLGFSVSHNNYKGMGYSIDASLGLEGSVGGGMTGGAGLGISLDPKEGIGVNPSLSLGGKYGDFGLGAGYNSKQGLTNISMSQTTTKTKVNEKAVKKVNGGISAPGFSLSMAHPGYTPQVSMPMKNVSLSATFKAGGAWWGIFGSPYVRGFYSEQWLNDNKKKISTPSFGYFNYQHASDPKALVDFNREKDGIVYKESPNMGIPSLSYDIYSVAGQGISAMYRPMRNDFGIIRDQETESTSIAASIGVDVGPAATHVGVNLGVNHSKSTSGGWTENNQMTSLAAFQNSSINSLYEPWYFKVHGESVGESVNTYNNIGGDKAVRVKLTGNNIDPQASSTLENKSWNHVAPSNNQINQERKQRNQVIQPITNEQLLSGNQEVISQFKVEYIDASGTTQLYNRSNSPKHHNAGFTALTPEGLRYTYGIPAYNLYQEEATFSVKKQTDQIARVNVGNNGGDDPKYDHSYTEKFLKKTEMPPYAHSFLLTSIIGPDYVDVTGNGISEEDLGYWVKFTYQKTTTNTDRYKWRDPFSKAHFQEGWKTDPRDDKGSFTYGEKELWYLARAETKSHIAIFTMSERQDGRGVASKLQDSNNKGKGVYALDEIKLFTRTAGSNTPLKITRFEYDYSLCEGIDNSSTNDGKLTLKKIWFEYGNSQRGRLNPYVFAYHESNPDYDLLAYDRWGNYKPYPSTDVRHNYDFPYAEQNPLKRTEINDQVSSWSLKEIVLPSGGKIIVDYESDDYGYVQQKTAMQMTSLVDPYSTSSQELPNTYLLNSNDLKVRFKLEKPLPGDLESSKHKPEVMKYLDANTKQLYFKMLINLRTPSEDFHEYISGYTDIDFAASMGLEKDNTGQYAYGYFNLIPEKGHHPFSMRAWQHLRTNQPELANSGRELKQTNSNNERAKQIKSLAGIGAHIRQMFEGFYDYCNSKGWGKEVVSNKSWIRLNSPDKIKYGGGLRVRQLTMMDNWEHSEEGIFGQVYEYTIDEADQQISSGVAAYEPIIGGEENALRYAKKFVQSVPLRSGNNLFFEYPINESYYPGAQVGYRKVTVSSLASASRSGKDVKNILLSDSEKLFPANENTGFGTSGVTVHEFYTAKDFPVITDETEKQNKPYKLSVLIPFLGSISVSKLAASQGYSIVTNDMHGKQKRVSNYRQDNSGAIDTEAISWVQYNYRTESIVYNKEKVFKISNVMKDNGDGTLSKALTSDVTNPSVQKFTLGQQAELFTDMRQFVDNTWGGGASINTDIVYIPLLFVVIPLPVFVPWPNISKTTIKLNTSVTNKIIFKAGILESIEAYDGGSRVVTENLKWDKLTGQPVLTRVNNNFDAPVYSYSIPAYTKYQGMGAAYQNIGLVFTLTNIQKAFVYRNDLFEFSTVVDENSLEPGDEILLYPSEGELANPLVRVVYSGEENDKQILYSPQELSSTTYRGMIVRSGHRNQLSVSAGSITALEDPSIKGTEKTYSTTITIPDID